MGEIIIEYEETDFKVPLGDGVVSVGLPVTNKKTKKNNKVSYRDRNQRTGRTQPQTENA